MSIVKRMCTRSSELERLGNAWVSTANRLVPLHRYLWKIWKTSQQVRKIGWTGWLAGEKQGSNSSFLKSLRSRPGAPRKNATPTGYRSEMKGMYWGQAWPMQCFWKPDTFGDIHSCFFRWARYLGYFVVYITCTCKHAVPWCFPSKIV